MRTIKFRAWDKKHNFMISPEDMYSYDEFISSLGKVIEIEGYSGYSGGGFNENDVTDERIIMQYTGLTDRNGKEIYEGDIVKGAHRANEEWVQMHEVKYSKGCFMFGNWNAHEYFNKHTYIEIIGNIYSNPELVSA